VTQVSAPSDSGDRLAEMTPRERLHQLVEELSDQEADDALRYIVQRREDPVIAAFRDAPQDDEPFTAADEDALAEVQADRAAGVPRISYTEIMRKHGDS
jgi:predicted ArsR family transcriptional regulator